MDAATVAVFTFAGLAGAAFASMALYDRLPDHHRLDDTNTAVRVIAAIFVTVTSLVLGLMINAAANTFLTTDRNVHVFATDLVLLDRTMRTLGPEADETRRHLVAYVEHALGPSPVQQGSDTSEHLLDAIGTSLRTIKLSGDQQIGLWNDARQIYHEVVRQRWSLVEQSGGGLPPVMIAIVIAWLVLIFASLGFRAPANAVVITSVTAASLLISASLYLVIDMNTPFTGTIQISDEPLRRVLAEIAR
jgi:amino acid transporter